MGQINRETLIGVGAIAAFSSPSRCGVVVQMLSLFYADTLRNTSLPVVPTLVFLVVLHWLAFGAAYYDVYRGQAGSALVECALRSRIASAPLCRLGWPVRTKEFRRHPPVASIPFDRIGYGDCWTGIAFGRLDGDPM
ncbi:MAG: hypothetical protein R3D61_12600 [Defluviimonas denitrificans]